VRLYWEEKKGTFKKGVRSLKTIRRRGTGSVLGEKKEERVSKVSIPEGEKKIIQRISKPKSPKRSATFRISSTKRTEKTGRFRKENGN